MPRSIVSVQRATTEHIPDIVRLWAEVRETMPWTHKGPAGEQSQTMAVTTVVEDPSWRVVIAEDEGQVVGFAVFSRLRPNPLTDLVRLNIDLLGVAATYQRHGVGRALICAAAAYAEEVGVEDVGLTVPAGMREANRWYAQLGFSPLGTTRSASVVVLRRKLGIGDRGDAVARRSRVGHARVRAVLRRTHTRS